MTRSSHRSRLLAGILVAAAALVPVTFAQTEKPKPGWADQFLGRWDLTVQGPQGPYPSWLEVQLREDDEIQARFVGRFGSVRYVTRIDYDSGRFSFTIPVQYEENKSDLVFKGTLTGDRLEGTTTDFDGKTLTWAGARAPLLRRTAAPTWGAPIELFNGRDLTGWTLRSQARGACWSIAGGNLTNGVPCVDIISDRQFTDFKAHIEFSYPAGSNSGIYLRGRYEVQIQDDAGKALDPQRMGGVYGFLRPYENAAAKAGEWQAYDITLIGRRVTVVLNGKTILEDEEIPGPTGGALNSDEGAPGPLMLQGDHTKIMFRKVVVTPAS